MVASTGVGVEIERRAVGRRTAAHVLSVMCLSVWTVANPTPAGADEYFTLVVSGATGGSEYAETYDRWRQTLVEALRAQDGFREDHLLILAETPGPGVGRASRDGVRQALDALRSRLSDHSVLLIVLLGHGTDDGVDTKFNLVGPDLDATEWAALLDGLPGQVTFVNTTAASFPFLRQLASPNRVVISATQSAVQRFDTVFPEYFVRALVEEAADADRDGRVSVWEAFAFSSAEVRRWFQRQGRLATERAMLDDTGDGRGKAADQDGGDGALSTRIFIGAGVDVPQAVSDPALVPLIAERDALEDRVAELKSRKDRVKAAVYVTELEQLLIELARVSREIRGRTSGS